VAVYKSSYSGFPLNVFRLAARPLVRVAQENDYRYRCNVRTCANGIKSTEVKPWRGITLMARHDSTVTRIPKYTNMGLLVGKLNKQFHPPVDGAHFRSCAHARGDGNQVSRAVDILGVLLESYL